jgi:preprotein translocase subunit SecD
MEQSWYGRVGLIVAVTLLSIYQLVPSWYYFKLPPNERNNPKIFNPTVPRWAPAAGSRLNLGLDLQGGILLDMGVDVDKAVKAKVTRRADAVAERLKDQKIPFELAQAVDGSSKVEVKTSDPGKVQGEVLSYFRDMSASKIDGGVQFAFQDKAIQDLREKAVEQAEKVIRNRIDQWGVTEPDIKRKANSQIQIQLPGAQDPEQAKKLLGQTALLEFKIVDDESGALDKVRELFPACKLDVLDQLDAAAIPDTGCWVSDGANGKPSVVSRNREALKAIVTQKLNPLLDPAKNLILTGSDVVGEQNAQVTFFRTYLLRPKTEMTGEYLADANVGQEQSGINQGSPLVLFEMSPEGAKLMGKLTQENIKKRMAIILDENVESAPTIQSQITSRGQITLGGGRGQNALSEAKMIATVLRSGALPAPLTQAAESTVGATLGPELITKGTNAALIGLALVLLFMLLYYRASGLIADVALVLNALLVLAVMAAMQSTLTLPGIAGFVLTLGMAVDANVLINERIREEMRAGKKVKVAVQQGYDKVFLTIVDSHVTTLVAGFMLMEFGSGPVRGFAVTLIIGLLASLFTSIVVTRVLMEYFTRHETAKLSV